MNNALPDKLIDAYRVNPMLGALLILNLATLGGFGWYLWDKETKTAKYVLMMQADMKELRLKAMDIAAQCSSRPLRH